MGDDARQEALFCAKLAEQAERYEEMVMNMKKIINMGITGDEVQDEERNLISVGYKNMMSTRRTAWRTVQQYEEKETNRDLATMIQAYKKTIAAEIYNIIDQVISDVVKKFTEGPQKATKPMVVVFFRKMEGDYYRYGAEISEGETRTKYREKAREAYSRAQELGEKELPSTDPILLGLALNFSVFYYEICEENQQAKELAKTAFDKAISELDDLKEDQYKDSTLIMQLLKDNLTLWNDSPDSEEEDLQVEEVEEIH